MPEELFDITDEHDQVIGQLPRSEVHRQKLLHRAVHVFLFNKHGELLLQFRSKNKDEYPQCYTSSASGHLSAGEDYHTCAPRELEEELGITAELEFLVKLPASSDIAFEHSALFRAYCDAELTPDPGEVEYVRFFSLSDLKQLMDESPTQFTPPLVALFTWYLEHYHAELC
jgi:16S rRNA (adenine1518-N6/adenine1519-N6)-dimethyltransferase